MLSTSGSKLKGVPLFLVFITSQDLGLDLFNNNTVSLKYSQMSPNLQEKFNLSRMLWEL